MFQSLAIVLSHAREVCRKQAGSPGARLGRPSAKSGRDWDYRKRNSGSERTFHKTYISSIELGKVSMEIEVARALACALGIKLSELVRRAE